MVPSHSSGGSSSSGLIKPAVEPDGFADGVIDGLVSPGNTLPGVVIGSVDTVLPSLALPPAEQPNPSNMVVVTQLNFVI
jgi:hypothetical protein